MSGSARPGMLQDVALACKCSDAKGWLFAADADTCFAPNFPLQRFVESAVISGRTTVALAPACTTDEACPGVCANLTSGTIPAESELERGAATKINSLCIDGDAPNDGSEAAMRTLPLVALPPGALAHFQEYADGSAAAGAGPWLAMERYVASRCLEQPVAGFCAAAAFSVRSLHAALFTDRFFHHWTTRQQEHDSVRSHKACSRLQWSGTGPPPGLLVSQVT